MIRQKQPPIVWPAACGAMVMAEALPDSLVGCANFSSRSPPKAVSTASRSNVSKFVSTALALAYASYRAICAILFTGSVAKTGAERPSVAIA